MSGEDPEICPPDPDLLPTLIRNSGKKIFIYKVGIQYKYIYKNTQKYIYIIQNIRCYGSGEKSTGSGS